MATGSGFVRSTVWIRIRIQACELYLLYQNISRLPNAITLPPIFPNDMIQQAYFSVTIILSLINLNLFPFDLSSKYKKQQLILVLSGLLTKTGISLSI